MLLDLVDHLGSPAFTTSEASDSLSRVYGALVDKEQKRYLFPAYPPFGDIVLADLQKVAPTVTYSPLVERYREYLATVPSLVDHRQLPAAIDFTTPPMDHQLEGTVHLYHHPRSALFWDAGCGKTKVLIDLALLLKGQRMLVIAPKIAVRNWVKEVLKHATGKLRAVALDGTPEKKRKLIAESAEFDILAMSYGTARNMGHPHVLPAVVKELKALFEAHRISKSGVQSLSRTISRLPTAEEQKQFVTRWQSGETLASLERESEELRRTRPPQWIEDIDYQIITADESHRIKDIGSDQTKSVLALSKKAPRRYLMSGTPTLGDPRHLYPQMKFLAPCIIPEDWLKFSDMFLVRSPWNMRIVTGYKNMDVLNRRIQRVALRKKKDECLDLPARGPPIDVPVKLSAEQTRLYNTLVSAMNVDLDAFFEGGGAGNNMLEVQNAATLLNKLAQVGSGFLYNSGMATDVCNGCEHLQNCVRTQVQPYTSRCLVVQQPPTTEVKYTKENPKLDALNDLLDTILANPENKVIVWTVFKPEVQMVKNACIDRGVDFVVVDGSTKDTQALVDEFEANPKCRVYISQIAKGISVTLNSAAYMIYFSLDWSLDHWEQSIDRNYRLGQTKKVFVYRLLGEGTVDEYKAIALDEKKDISALLTNKIACVTCPKRIECLKAGVELFDEGCMYKRSAKRTIARAKVLT